MPEGAVSGADHAIVRVKHEFNEYFCGAHSLEVARRDPNRLNTTRVAVDLRQPKALPMVYHPYFQRVANWHWSCHQEGVRRVRR